MAKARIYDLAKNLGVTSKDIIDYLDSKGIKVMAVSVIEDNEAEQVKKHFKGGSAKPVSEETKEVKSAVKQKTEQQEADKKPVRTMKPAPQQQIQPRKMYESSEARDRQQREQRSIISDKPLRRPDQNRPDGQRRRMADGPYRQDQQSRTHTIKGVTISSDDGNRLIHGAYKQQSDIDRLRQERAKENSELKKAERAEAERKAAEKAKKEEELVEQVRKEQARNEEIQNKLKAVEEKKAAEEKERQEALKAEAEAKQEKPAEPEKVFKTTGGRVSDHILGYKEVNRAAMTDSRPDRRPFNRDGRSGDRPQGDRQQGDRNGFQRDNRNGENRPFNRDGRQGDNRNNGNRNVDRNHYQDAGSRYNGDNRGHSNLYASPSAAQRGDRPQNGGNRNDFRNRQDRGFSVRPQGGFGGGKDDDESKPISHSRDPKKRSNSGVSELAAQMKQPRRDKSKDKEKANKRFNDFDEMEGGKKGKNAKDPNRAGAFHKPEAVKTEAPEEVIKTITLPDVLTIQELADKMKIKGSEIVKKLFMAGKMVSLNSDITFEEAENIAIDYEIIAEHEEKIDKVAELLKEEEEDESKLKRRPPVVCVMGHVDHGKTSLLDAIRTTSVISHEAGGITQHIGAYTVTANGEQITFLDTPGHEAFTAMRMRGANSTDIAVLVVAADDGVMPQTVEAINHAKAAGVEIIVAVNKIDKPTANVDRVKQELTEYELVAEDWGGSTVFVPVSAHTKEGIDKLLEMILLTADVLELKANPNRKARGLVIEAQLDKGRGPVATVLVQKGTLKVGDNVVIGSSMGKVRALVNDKGERVKEAGPSMPVEVLGLNSVPDAGEIVVATASEKEAREISEAYIEQNKEKLIADTKSKLSLDGLFSQIKAGNIKELNIIVKADVQGSVEAIKQSLVKLSNDEVAVRIIHGGVGAINESDATLASASNAIIIGFNVKPDNTAKDICEREKVDLRLYSVIYNAIDDVEAAMKGLLDPVFEEQVIAHAEVRQTFKASGVGTIAGAFVLDGKIVKGCKARIQRAGEQIFDGNLASLKRFKDDVKEVNAGYECGLVFEKFSDIIEGDTIELYQMVEVPRK